MFRLYDGDGKCIYKYQFSKYSEAHQFRMMNGRPDWKIVEE